MEKEKSGGGEEGCRKRGRRGGREGEREREGDGGVGEEQ